MLLVKPYRRIHWWLLPVVLLMFTRLLGANPSLQVWGEKNNQRLPFAGIKDQQLLVRDGAQLRPAGDNTVWRVDGEFGANAGSVAWMPKHSIYRPTDFVIAANADQFQRVTINLEHVATGDDSPFLKLWPDGLPNGGVLFAIWLVEGRAVKVQAQPLPSTTNGKGFARHFSMVLSQDEARGQPILLLWRDGGFIAPTPFFTDAATQQAFVATLLDDVAALNQAVQSGAKLKKLSLTGMSLAHIAAAVGAEHTLKALLEQAPSLLNFTAKVQSTPLYWAAIAGRVNTTRLLISAKAKPIAINNEEDPLQKAAQGGHIEVVKVLVEAGARLEMHGYSPLQGAISSGKTAIAESLLAAGAKYDFSRPGSEWAMVDSAQAGNVTMVKLLLAHGVAPNALQFSMQSKSDPSLNTDKGMTALMGAAEGKSLATADVLLANGADPNRQTARGVTALQIVAKHNAVDLVGALLAHGADVALRNKNGFSALDIALLEDSVESANLLARAGARISLVGQNATTLFECALRHDCPGVIAGALAAGWSPNAELSGGWPAVSVAKEFEAHACEQILREAGAKAPESVSLVKATELDLLPKLMKAAPPEDTRSEYEKTEQTIKVTFLINQEGIPLFAKIINSTDHRLAVATLRSVSAWRFTQPLKNGQAVTTRVTLPVVFKGMGERNFIGVGSRLPIAIERVAPRFPLLAQGASGSKLVILSSGGGGSTLVKVKSADTGLVLLNFDVDENGDVQNIAVKKSYEPAFADAAINTLKQWRFQPGVRAERAATMRMEIQFQFSPPYWAQAGIPYQTVIENP